MNNRICPLLSIAEQTTYSCNNDRCAWWDNAARACALAAIAEHLDRIALMQEEANGL